MNVLSDGEEVTFDMHSLDLWLLVYFNFESKDENLVFGSAEFRIEKQQKLS